jgi:hypothetical protein
MPGRPAPGDDSPLRLIPVPDLPPLPVGWAVRRWDALATLARIFADTVADICTEKAAHRDRRA